MFKKIYFLFCLVSGNVKKPYSKKSLPIQTMPMPMANNMALSSMALLGNLGGLDYNVKFELTTDTNSKNFSPSCSSDFNFTTKEENNNTDVIVNINFGNFFKKNDLNYLNYLHNKNPNLNNKGEFVPITSKNILRIINNQKEGFFNNYISDEFKNSSLGVLLDKFSIVVKNYSDNGSFSEISVKSFKIGGIFDKIGEFKYLDSLHLGENFFSENASFLIGGGKIFNKQHILGLKLISDLDKWNTILSHVLLIESVKLVPYFATQSSSGLVKFLIAPVISYGYNKKDLIDLYSSYSSTQDVDLIVADDNGKFNFLVPVSLAVSVVQLEGVYNYQLNDFKGLFKIQLIDGKNWKVSFNGSNSAKLGEDKPEFSKMGEIFTIFKQLNLGLAISYTINGHTFTLKWKGDVGKDNFSYDPFSTANANFDTETLKYIVSLLKFNYKYEVKSQKKPKIQDTYQNFNI
jgi:hypothetical protein